MKNTKTKEFNALIIGSGIAGLSSALNLAKNGLKVAVVTKQKLSDCNSRYAQGGIACVLDKFDTFDEHVKDTLNAGGDLCKENVVRLIVEAGPAAIDELINYGTKFTTRGELGLTEDSNGFDLGKEGGHTKRRVIHSGDITGAEIERVLVETAVNNENIEIFEDHSAIDLIVPSEKLCIGAYVLNCKTNAIENFIAPITVIACGGAGKVYLYTSNPDVACGAGVAMGYRAGAKIANMEFIQFHPTILHHPELRSFLISEAVRGEGAVLKCRPSREEEPVEFMHKYHAMGSLAPRDVVARAIDSEMKRSGEECVYLDIRQKSEAELKLRFPNIFKACLDCGINMAEDLIPVVPAAHYVCGGIETTITGATNIKGLYAVGESGCTGLHGANRLASNSLLEALVIPKYLANEVKENFANCSIKYPENSNFEWINGNAINSDEQVVIAHNWDEIRRFMWDYVGICRTNKRLERAKTRVKLIRKEIEKYYWDFLVTADLIELRNIATVAELIIDSSLKRKESRGLHYNADYPLQDHNNDGVDTIIQREIL